VTCSDDGLLRIFSFCVEKPAVEVELRGHGLNVTCVAWHPTDAALIASGSKDNTVKLWDGGSGREVATLSKHTGFVLQCAWNPHNGWWLCSASRDQTLRLTDVRTMRDFAVISAEHAGAMALAWHPHAEPLLAAGFFDGALAYYDAHHPEFALAEVRHAHDSAVRDVAWHPLGHELASCSNDTTVKVWVQSRPGDTAEQYACRGNPTRAYAPEDNLNITTPVPRGGAPIIAAARGGGAGVFGPGAGGAGGAGAGAGAAAKEAMEKVGGSAAAAAAGACRAGVPAPFSRTGEP